MPNQNIGISSELVYYTGSPTGTRFDSAGSPDDWKRDVASLASGNRLLLLAISIAFSGPLFGLLREGAIGIHLRGPSSCGKTSALIVAGSVWGGGGRNGFCGTWRATANGLEGVAAAHSGTCLVLDELSEIDPQEAGKAAYALLNGSGKQRAGRSVIDVPADGGEGMGIFEFLHGRDSAAAFCDELRQAALTSYGTAGPKFIRKIAENQEATILAAERLIDATVQEPAPAPPADSGANPPVSSAHAGRDYTITQITSL